MAILERNSNNTKNRFWDSEDKFFPVKNRYTAGVAGQKFLKELKENGKIYGTRCENCGITFVPAKLYCERCFARLDDKKNWTDVGTAGTLFAYTVARKEKDGTSKKEPAVIAAIKIADGILLHYLEGVKPEEIRIGMDVTAVMKPKKDRTGSMMDIKCFKKA